MNRKKIEKNTVMIHAGRGKKKMVPVNSAKLCKVTNLGTAPGIELITSQIGHFDRVKFVLRR